MDRSVSELTSTVRETQMETLAISVIDNNIDLIPDF